MELTGARAGNSPVGPVVEARRLSGGGRGGRMPRCRRSGEGRRRGEGGVWKAGDVVEAERSREIFLTYALAHL